MRARQRELPERVPVIRREEVRAAWQRLLERRRRAGLSTWELEGDVRHPQSPQHKHRPTQT